MKIITTTDHTIIIDERDRSPMELYGGKEAYDIDTAAEELSSNGKTVHVVRPAYDWDGNLLFHYRVSSYVDGKHSTAFDSLVKIDVPKDSNEPDELSSN